jgi:hypothetical protein
MVIDHRYVDDNRVAERYLRRALLPHESAAFECHLVDCEECSDRVLLAEMFFLRNGNKLPVPSFATLDKKPPAQEKLPLRARFVAQWKPWQLLLVAALGALLLLAVPTAYFLWQLRTLESALNP